MISLDRNYWEATNILFVLPYIFRTERILQFWDKEKKKNSRRAWQEVKRKLISLSRAMEISDEGLPRLKSAPSKYPNLSMQEEYRGTKTWYQEQKTLRPSSFPLDLWQEKKTKEEYHIFHIFQRVSRSFRWTRELDSANRGEVDVSRSSPTYGHPLYTPRPLCLSRTAPGHKNAGSPVLRFSLFFLFFTRSRKRICYFNNRASALFIIPSTLPLSLLLARLFGAIFLFFRCLLLLYFNKYAARREVENEATGPGSKYPVKMRIVEFPVYRARLGARQERRELS